LFWNVYVDLFITGVEEHNYTLK